MDFLNHLLDSSQVPVFTAFLLGLLTALSPCPLATNVTAVGYITRGCMACDDDQQRARRGILWSGVLYTLGRTFSYTLLGVILIYIIRIGKDTFGLQQVVSEWGELILGPSLILIGFFMLFGDKLHLPKFGFNGNINGMMKGAWDSFVLGILFALAFCPTSGLFYFGMLIPMSAETTAGYLLPLVFAIATALPVLLVAWILAYSMQSLGKVMGRITAFQRWLNRIVALLFIIVGMYYIVTINV